MQILLEVLQGDLIISLLNVAVKQIYMLPESDNKNDHIMSRGKSKRKLIIKKNVILTLTVLKDNQNK